MLLCCMVSKWHAANASADGNDMFSSGIGAPLSLPTAAIGCACVVFWQSLPPNLRSLGETGGETKLDARVSGQQHSGSCAQASILETSTSNLSCIMRTWAGAYFERRIAAFQLQAHLHPSSRSGKQVSAWSRLFGCEMQCKDRSFKLEADTCETNAQKARRSET